MIKLLKIGGPGYMVDEDGYYHEYVCDTVADVSELPTGEGIGKSRIKPRPRSTAVVADNASVYMLSNARKWGVLIKGE